MLAVSSYLSASARWGRQGLEIAQTLFRNRLSRLLVSAACLIVLLYGLFRQIHAQTYVQQLIDFYPYYHAALAVRGGADPYGPGMTLIRHFKPGDALTGLTYVYAPLFAYLLVPFTFFPYHVALVLWDACLLGFLVGAIWVGARLTNLQLSPTGILLLSAAASIESTVRDELYLAQADIFLLFLVVVAFWALVQRRTWFAALALAVACVIKPYLLILVAFLLWKRELKGALACLGGVVTLFFLPFLWLGGGALHDLFVLLQFWSTEFIAYENNDAPKAVLARLFSINPYVHPLFDAPWLMNLVWAAIAGAVMLVLAATISRRPFGRDVRSCVELSAVLVGMLLASPLSEYIHLTLLILPLLSLLALLRSGMLPAPAHRTVAVGTAIIALLLCVPWQHITWQLTWYAQRHPAPSPTLTILYAFGAATYLPLIIALFVLEIYVLCIVESRSAGQAIHQLYDAIFTASQRARYQFINWWLLRWDTRD